MASPPTEVVLKLHITGVYKFNSSKQLTKDFAKAGVHPTHVRKPPKAGWAVCSFADVAARDAAIPLLNKLTQKGRPMRAKVYEPLTFNEEGGRDDRDGGGGGQKKKKKRGADGDEGGGDGGDGDANEGNKKPRMAADIRDVVTPNHGVPYGQQLELKQAEMAKEVILKSYRQLHKTYTQRQKMFANSGGAGGEAHQSAGRARMPGWLQPRSAYRGTTPASRGGAGQKRKAPEEANRSSSSSSSSSSNSNHEGQGGDGAEGGSSSSSSSSSNSKGKNGGGGGGGGGNDSNMRRVPPHGRGLYVPLEAIRASPATEGYRNKCDFTIGPAAAAPLVNTDGSTDGSTDGAGGAGTAVAADSTAAASEGAGAAAAAAAAAAAEEEGAAPTPTPPPPTVLRAATGFCLGRERDGSIRVAEPEGCSNVSAMMQRLCRVFDSGFLASSPLPPYRQLDHSGVWRGLVVRTSERTRQTMVVVMASTAKLLAADGGATEAATAADGVKEAGDTGSSTSSTSSSGRGVADEEKEAQKETGAAVWARERARLVSFFAAAAPEVTSLFLQIYDGVSAPNPDEPVELLAGSDHIVEELRIGRLFPGNEGGGRRTATEDAVGDGDEDDDEDEDEEAARRKRRKAEEGRGGAGGAGGAATASTTVTTVPPLRFKISPGAFFQTNTLACEVLYRTVLELAELTSSDTLVDVCCGTGTIGICAAAATVTKAKGNGAAAGEGQQERRLCGKVVGVELCAAAVECAKENSEANGVGGGGRTEWVCSRAELVMEKLLDGTSTASKYASSSSSSSSSSEKEAAAEEGDGPGGGAPSAVVAVVDPPRSGLHRSVLVALRNCATIRRLVYVSCNPTGSLLPDLVALCGPSSKQLTGACFRPVRAVPVDLFPATAHTEMVIALERYDAAAEAAFEAAAAAEAEAKSAAAAAAKAAEAEAEAEAQSRAPEEDPGAAAAVPALPPANDDDTAAAME